MNSIALSQLLMEMNADSPDLHTGSQPMHSHQYHCQCFTDKHQPASICIEHFTINSDDERSLSNIAGNPCAFMHVIVQCHCYTSLFGL